MLQNEPINFLIIDKSKDINLGFYQSDFNYSFFSNLV